MAVSGKRKFSELKESTKNEIAELMTGEGYKPSGFSGFSEAVKIDLNKDLSVFSNLSQKTQKEIAELMTAGDYTPKQDGKNQDKAGFDGFRIMKIEEFLGGERQKMQEFMKTEEEDRHAKEREFADRSIMRKNLGMIEESEIESKVKKAEPAIAFSEREKKIEGYILEAKDTNESLKRAMQVAGSEDIKSIMMNALKINKEYSPF